MKIKNLFAMALSLVAVACNTKVETPLQYGELSVALSEEPAVELVSKAAVTLDPSSVDAAGFTVRILDMSNKEKYKKTYNEFTTQTLQLGTYYVTAENCSETDAEAGAGKMRLYGRSSNVTLTADNLSQTAIVNCTVANAKVSVLFDDSVTGRFTNLKVVLSGGTTAGRSLTITENKSDMWFNPSTLTYNITGKFNSGGIEKDVNISKSIVLEAKNNIQLVVSVNLENGQLLVPTITYDTTIPDPTPVPEEFNPYV